MKPFEAILLEDHPKLELDIKQLERAVAAIVGHKSLDMIYNSYGALLLRVLETALISDPGMISLIRTPGVYLGREDVEVRRILMAYGFDDVSEVFVDFFVQIIRGRVAHSMSKERLGHVMFGEVVDRQYVVGADLRCASCGYHFLASDMAEDRLEEVQRADVHVASVTPAERFRDPWKPAKPNYRQLTVDHILPEAALGPRVVENLRIVCGFCNQRRQIARRHLESLGPRVSASLLAITGGHRGQWAVEAAVYFAICQGGACIECEEDSSSAELTAVPYNEDYKWTGVLPWQLKVCCYAHSGL
jgi:hypothetical protein